MTFENSLSFAKRMDKTDGLRSYRSKFHHPKIKSKPVLYFTGNSLGLQPKVTKQWITEELNDWANWGVEGHIHSKRPWLYYHKFSKKALARLVGAKPIEVVAMNQLTVNLHLMMTTFYRPTAKRFKILTEAGAFSSDQYAFESQIKLHGLNPAEALIELSPRDGEHTLRQEDIIQAIENHGNSIALVIFGAVQYYTGQFFNIKAISKAAHQAGAYVGFDLAHAIGNVPLNLHKDEVDFAVWCSYKYLNAGPGGIAGAFVHEKHANNLSMPRMAGWWGHHERDRFQMKKGFIPMQGADGWQLSNVPILTSAALLASLSLFDEVGLKALRTKSVQLTNYLEFLLYSINNHQQYFTIITPANPAERGCQLSILMKQNGRKIFDSLLKSGVIGDWREPNVIRVAPVPFYNTYADVFNFVALLKKYLS